MSVEHNTVEEIRIYNVNDSTKEIVHKITNNLKALFSGERLEACNINEIVLTVNGNTTSAKNLECGYFAEQDNSCSDFSEFTKLLDFESINALEIQLDYSAMVLSGGSYGYSFMQDIANEAEKNALVHLSYKLMEYYDCGDGVVLCKLEDGVIKYPSENATFDDIADISDWYSYNFEISITTDDEFDEETTNLLTELAEDFAKNYFDGDEIDEPDMDELSLFHSVSLDNVSEQSFIELKERIDRFVRLAVEKDFEISLDIDFTPDGVTQKYAVVSIVLNGKNTEIIYSKI